MTTDDDFLRIIGSENITDDNIRQFIQSLKKPFDMRNKIWKPEDNERIEKLQNLTKAFFESLKLDNIIKLNDVFHSPKDPLEILKQTRNNMSIYSKLYKTDEFTGDEQFLILCSLYLFWVEQIKTLFLPYIERIYYAIPKNVRKKERIRKANSKSTITPVLDVLRKYKNGKYSALFSDINVELRNAIAHFNFYFGETDITYDGRTISGQDFLVLVKNVTLLFPILHGTPQEIFANEMIDELRKRGYDIE